MRLALRPKFCLCMCVCVCVFGRALISICVFYAHDFFFNRPVEDLHTENARFDSMNFSNFSVSSLSVGIRSHIGSWSISAAFYCWHALSFNLFLLQPFSHTPFSPISSSSSLSHATEREKGKVDDVHNFVNLRRGTLCISAEISRVEILIVQLPWRWALLSKAGD